MSTEPVVENARPRLVDANNSQRRTNLSSRKVHAWELEFSSCSAMAVVWTVLGFGRGRRETSLSVGLGRGLASLLGHTGRRIFL
ncbi:hypothetical protein SCLCIDRAFT_1223564 [Scleroderma citrinum Foug A]|uniref:Uncharacterized protein n=1 Tax=Scleroderma citrinum Foug A TaxID=1036808 RepID=A0A0C3CVR6_9AGAM|nr:hypothetical protein SCLCIDRAFT_1223564 [Scleroderma citrinum Foug A]